MKTKLLTFILLFSTTIVAVQAQCGCTFTLKSTHPVRNEFDPTDMPGLKAGDVICLETGNWVSILFKDIVGAPGNPIIIQNCGGLVDISGDFVGMQFEGSQYIKVTGTGDENEDYGILVSAINNGGTNGMAILGKSSDIEIEHVEVSNTQTGGSGISAKTDPDCADTMTWRPNFVMRNIIIHDNYIHDVGNEGLYIGYTGGYLTTKKKCSGVDAFGHLIENVQIYNNRIVGTGRDGMQVSLCHKDLLIYDNYIEKYGDNGEFDQDFGLSIGSGSQARVYGNTIIQTSDVNASTLANKDGRGISVLSALPPTYVHSNITVASPGKGIWMHQRMDIADKSQGYYIINNTIINPGDAGIFYNSTVPSTTNDQEDLDHGFYNNIIVNPGADYENSGFWKDVPEEYIDFNKKIQRDNGIHSNNFTTDNIDTLKFFDKNGNDFHIGKDSPARDFGMDVKSYGVTHDLDGREYGFDGTFDVGAYEYSDNPIGIGEDESQRDFKVYPNPAQKEINISIALDRSADARVRLIDLRGAKIAEGTFQDLKAGDNTITLKLDDVHFKGAALLVLFAGDKTRTSTIVIE